MNIKIKVIKRCDKPELRHNPDLGKPQPVYKKLSITRIREQWLEEHREATQLSHSGVQTEDE